MSIVDFLLKIGKKGCSKWAILGKILAILSKFWGYTFPFFGNRQIIIIRKIDTFSVSLTILEIFIFREKSFCFTVI